MDEQLVPFRWSSKFQVSTGHAKLAHQVCRKIFYKARTIDGMDYTNIAQKSCNRFRNTGCNFTTDNFFSSASLAQHHLEKDFIVLGTLQQNKADILPLIPSTPSEFYSTDFRFSGSLTMFSCVRKRGMAPVHNASQQSGGWKRSEKDQK